MSASIPASATSSGGEPQPVRRRRRLFRARSAVIGGTVILLLALLAVFAPAIAPFSPFATDIPARLQAPSLHHLFGTDYVGRDVFSRVVWGTRISLPAALGAVAFGAALGTLVGLMSGYYRGTLGQALTQVIDVFMAFPLQLMAILVVAALGQSELNAAIAVGVATFPSFARILRSEVLKLREQEFVEAVRALGAPHRRVMWRHILPNASNSLIVIGTLRIGNAILIEAVLSFLGLGTQPPSPAWGLMIAHGQSYLQVAPWVSIAPGVMIMLAVLGFSLLGDGLRDLLDPDLST